MEGGVARSVPGPFVHGAPTRVLEPGPNGRDKDETEMNAAPTAVFDLDGTLVDSAPDIHAALNRMLATRGLAPYSLAEVTRMIGDGAKVLVERAFAGRCRDHGSVRGRRPDPPARRLRRGERRHTLASHAERQVVNRGACTARHGGSTPRR